MSKDKRFWISFVAVILSIVTLLTVLHFTYVLRMFSFSSSSNSPTIPPHQVVVTSKLKKTKLLDFIVFKNITPKDSSVSVLRVCGLPGDSVEIRNGDLFVNGKLVDSTLTLSHSYIVSPKDTAGLNFDKSAAVSIADTSVLITYPDKDMRKQRITSTRYILPEVIEDAYMQKMFHQSFNLDHFGPVKVPAHSYFVLGDNRSNALDSRYLGFISEKDILGTVVYY
jgi:signal peptidase I